jgi:hypothetical protein
MGSKTNNNYAGEGQQQFTGRLDCWPAQNVRELLWEVPTGKDVNIEAGESLLESAT